MRSSKETGCFPYSSKTVCYIEVFPNGDIHQLGKTKLTPISTQKAERAESLPYGPDTGKATCLLLMTLRLTPMNKT